MILDWLSILDGRLGQVLLARWGQLCRQRSTLSNRVARVTAAKPVRFPAPAYVKIARAKLEDGISLPTLAALP